MLYLTLACHNCRFLTRSSLGPVPLNGDHFKAWSLYRSKFFRLFQKHASTVPHIFDEIWDRFVLSNTWSSRVIAALPNKRDYPEMERIGLTKLKRRRMTRSTKWLREHGVCADHFHMNVSTLPQAGHGAFASHFLPKDTVVLPVPVLPIPYRSVLNMYQIRKGNNQTYLSVDRRKVIGQQLILNYCLGHAESTMLLFPYGPVFPLINHNQSLVNVRLQWASTTRSNHHPELLEKNVSHFEETTAALALELVTLRSIEAGEEIFLDYGDDWEKAWNYHAAIWNPVEGAETYKSAAFFNTDASPLRTEFEQMETPYPSNVVLKFDDAFLDRRAWKLAERRGTLTAWKDYSRGKYIDCEILRYQDKSGMRYYTISVRDKIDSKRWVVIKHLPREAFSFQDKPYTSDMFLSNAFRHDMRIPDEIFPLSWKNQK